MKCIYINSACKTFNFGKVTHKIQLFLLIPTWLHHHSDHHWERWTYQIRIKHFLCWCTVISTRVEIRKTSFCNFYESWCTISTMRWSVWSRYKKQRMSRGEAPNDSLLFSVIWKHDQTRRTSCWNSFSNECNKQLLCASDCVLIAIVSGVFLNLL